MANDETLMTKECPNDHMTDSSSENLLFVSTRRPANGHIENT
jgi:hypothetical protein